MIPLLKKWYYTVKRIEKGQGLYVLDFYVLDSPKQDSWGPDTPPPEPSVHIPLAHPAEYPRIDSAIPLLTTVLFHFLLMKNICKTLF